MDVGLDILLVTAQEEALANLRHYRKTEKRQRAKAQKRLARRKKQSKRCYKALRLLARTREKVRRQRREFRHTTAVLLLRIYDTICLEDLRVANLVEHRPPSTSISDAGWAKVRTILEVKAVYAGRRVAAVPPAYTTQDRSGCGERIKKSLSVRRHVCPSCWLVMDRGDVNAARNIVWAGQTRRGTVGQPAVLQRASVGR